MRSGLASGIRAVTHRSNLASMVRGMDGEEEKPLPPVELPEKRVLPCDVKEARGVSRGNMRKD